MRLFSWLCVSVLLAGPASAVEHGERPDRLIIQGGTIVDGSGTPPEGPANVYVENGRIVRVTHGRAVENAWEDAAAIDATDHYVLPGFINMHGHIHTTWAGHPSSLEYIYKLWLAAGITTVRDVGSDTAVTSAEKEKSDRFEIAAPRILLYFWFPNGRLDVPAKSVDEMSPREIAQAVRDIKERGADGIKIRHFNRDQVRHILAAAKQEGLPVAHHIGIEDMDARDAAEFGVRTIEHWYGVPDAALDGVQSFPADFNHSNELHRFRYAGRLWREMNIEKLDAVLNSMIDADTAWDPTFGIYEASRDLQRAVTQPAFAHYLHPHLAKFFEPNPDSHGSFFFGWTHTDEVYWKENYRIWMDAVLRFDRMGGLVTTGEDAGYIYQVYGFCYLRELQLHEEAGFHPLEVIRNATHNGAKALYKEDELGLIRPGYRADILVVNGNPLTDLRILMPRGVDETLDYQHGEHGGIAWTIKEGAAYRPSVLLEEVRRVVEDARAEN